MLVVIDGVEYRGGQVDVYTDAKALHPLLYEELDVKVQVNNEGIIVTGAVESGEEISMYEFYQDLIDEAH